MSRTLWHETTSARARFEIGSGILADSGAIITQALAGRPASGVLFVCDEAVNAQGSWADQVASSINGECSRVAIHASEATKSIAQWQSTLEKALAVRLDRDSVIVAIGGGVITDLAGFAAATYMRGIRWVAVPTTLLGMVDAALGGKTGVNIPLPDGGLGKNLAGAFWPPEAIIADVRTLSTLPARHVRAGLAECLKHALIADPGLAAIAAGAAAAATSAEAVDQWKLMDLVSRSAQVKLDIVAKDERETGLRRHLNLGHTFAHAIEARGCDGLVHGEAVAVGLVAAAAASVAAGKLRPEQAVAIKQMVASVGLPVVLKEPVSAGSLVDAAASDKKGSRGTLMLVLPVSGGGVESVPDSGGALFRAGVAAVGAGSS